MVKQTKERYKRRNNLVAITIGVFVLVWVIFNILFPVFKINDGLENDFSIRTINDKKYLELKIKGGYSFHRIFMKMDVDGTSETNGVLLKKVYQDELGLYVSEDIINTKEHLDRFLTIKGNEDDDIKNGELIQKGDFVYFISDGRYRAFANAETFDMLGFGWNNVQRGKSDLLSNLTKGRVIDKTISYLPSMFVEIGEKTYLLGLEEKYLIDSEELINYVRSEFSVIKVDNRKLQTVGEMKCKRSGKNKVVCKFKDNLRKVLPQATVFIELEGNLKAKWTSKIYTFNKFNSLVPRRTLGNIKRNLVLRYDQRFGFKEGDQK